MDQRVIDSDRGLKFFGRVSASVSHEIKNVFAVINEAAGLIEDFTLMAERGTPLQPERLKKAANSIQGQVRRGDAIVKNMNAFAHSTDEDTREVDLVEILELTVALSTRMADMKQIRLSQGDCKPASFSANPFDLMRLLHSSIAAVLESMDSGDSLTIGVFPAQNGAVFTLAVPGKGAPRLDEKSLFLQMQSTNTTVAVSKNGGTLELLITPAQGPK